MEATPPRRTVVIQNPEGLHMRPAAVVSQTAKQYQAKLTLIFGDRQVNPRDPFQLLMLAAMPGSEMTLEGSGPDAAEAVAAVAEILAAPDVPASFNSGNSGRFPPPPPKG